MEEGARHSRAWEDEGGRGGQRRMCDYLATGGTKPGGGGGGLLSSRRQLPPPTNCWPEAPFGGGGGTSKVWYAAKV